MAFVAGRNRVPRPAAGMTAFVIRSCMAVRSLSFAWSWWS
jgi:hypothetical protein